MNWPLHPAKCRTGSHGCLTGQEAALTSFASDLSARAVTLVVSKISFSQVTICFRPLSYFCQPPSSPSDCAPPSPRLQSLYLVPSLILCHVYFILLLCSCWFRQWLKKTKNVVEWICNISKFDFFKSSTLFFWLFNFWDCSGSFST